MSEDRPVQNVLGLIDRPVRGLRIGIQKRWFFENIDPALEKALDDAIAAYRGSRRRDR